MGSWPGNTWASDLSSAGWPTFGAPRAKAELSVQEQSVPGAGGLAQGNSKAQSAPLIGRRAHVDRECARARSRLSLSEPASFLAQLSSSGSRIEQTKRAQAGHLRQEIARAQFNLTKL